MKIAIVAGARPNFIKIAPIMRAFHAREGLEPFLVHTGQHYDAKMSELFFSQLGIPAPDVNLEVGSGSHAVQTAAIMERFEKVLLDEGPDLTLVVGDVNSTMACAITSTKLHVPVVHVEAGLRSGDRRMPEEINRLVTDAISSLLFVTEQSGLDNLAAEGIARDKIRFVGNVMIDTLLANREKAAASDVLERLGVEPGRYAALTLHRPSNVDHREVLERLLAVILDTAEAVPVVFAAHPRTRARLRDFGLMERVEAAAGMILVDPLGYLEFLRLSSEARLILTDSGGIQEEATITKVPCITMRENTERPVSVDCGANVLVGSDPEGLRAEIGRVLAGERGAIETPPLWDGKAAERIAEAIAGWTPAL